MHVPTKVEHVIPELLLQEECLATVITVAFPLIDAGTPVTRGIARGGATQCVLPRGRRSVCSAEVEILLTVLCPSSICVS